MELAKITRRFLKIVLPLVLGGAILYWMYRNNDWGRTWEVMTRETNWWWMLLSFPFGISAQVLRGLRWKQTLEPIGEHTRTSTSIYSIFLSYATSLVIPRVGEFVRCSVVKRYDGVNFSKALGTVVTERAVDAVMMLLMIGVALLLQLSVMNDFFATTGTSFGTFLRQFTSTGYVVTFICLLAVLIMAWILIKKLQIYNKVKTTLGNLWQGVVSLKNVSNIPLYIFFTIGIWGSYFLHFYLTFFCFDATAGLSIGCALVSFVVGSIAVIVPTPNGAGPWHFSVKTILILYGVQSEAALCFVLIVHTVQTLLVVLLGVYGWAALSLTKRKTVGKTS